MCRVRGVRSNVVPIAAPCSRYISRVPTPYQNPRHDASGLKSNSTDKGAALPAGLARGAGKSITVSASVALTRTSECAPISISTFKSIVPDAGCCSVTGSIAARLNSQSVTATAGRENSTCPAKILSPTRNEFSEPMAMLKG